MQIIYSGQAKRFLKRQNTIVRKRLVDAIEKIPEGKGDIKKLEGRQGWRLRVGIYRIIFDKDGRILFIERINTRGDVYKGGF